ncbi:MAG: N-acetylglucosamine kinase [Vulcanimicrobiaceae bacterium]
MIVCAGIDGGQSSTEACVGDEHGTILGKASGPPADLVDEPRDSPRQAHVLDGVLAEALAAAGLPCDAPLAALVAGLSGYDEGVSPVPRLRANAATISFVHDTTVAHAAALAGSAGIVVLAGTGSVAVGCDPVDSPPVRAGGWGYFFGDEGSALWIARTALRRAMWRADFGGAGVLERLALKHFALGSLRALQHAVAHGEIDRPALAAFAPAVLAAGRAGDADARAIRSNAADELAALAQTVDERLEPASLRLVSYVGGLFADEAFSEAFEDALVVALPHAEIIAPFGEPVHGALRLAMRAAGLARPADTRA